MRHDQDLSYEDLDNEKECPECGVMAPERQVESLGMCERCHYNSDDGSSREQVKVSDDAQSVDGKSWKEQIRDSGS